MFENLLRKEDTTKKKNHGIMNTCFHSWLPLISLRNVFFVIKCTAMTNLQPHDIWWAVENELTKTQRFVDVVKAFI